MAPITLLLARDAGIDLALSAANGTIANASSITPTFVKIVSPWMPTIDTVASIAGDGLGLIVKGIQLGVAVRQLHSLFRIENVAQQQQVVQHIHYHAT